MQNQPIKINQGNGDRPARRGQARGPNRSRIAVALVALALLGVGGSSTAQEPQAQESSSCQAPGHNIQCTDFGTIQMEARRDVRGEPVRIAAQIELHTAYGDQGARWIMFSVRNHTTEGDSPITVSLKTFSTSFGDVVTTRIDKERPSELNIWVDVLDVPLDTPITLEVEVGASERGAYGLETLVLAFDRVYEPVQVQGTDATLFSSTLLGVNKETASSSGASNVLDRSRSIPGIGLLAALAALALTMAGLYRGRRA